MCNLFYELSNCTGSILIYSLRKSYTATLEKLLQFPSKILFEIIYSTKSFSIKKIFLVRGINNNRTIFEEYGGWGRTSQSKSAMQIRSVARRPRKKLSRRSNNFLKFEFIPKSFQNSKDDNVGKRKKGIQ